MPWRPHLPRSRRRRRGVLVWVLLVALLVAVGLVGAIGGSEQGAAAVATEHESSVAVGPEADGEEVSLDVSVFAPAPGTAGADGEGRRAAVMLGHGFGGSKDDLLDQALDLAGEGFVVLTWSARGFGDSGGLIHLDSPDYEVADASVLLDLLAARDDVLLDADGDPRVGIAGASYGGALALMAAALDGRVDAIVPVITWHDLSQAFFPQDAVDLGDGHVPEVGVFKQRWAALFFSGALAQAGIAAAAAVPGQVGAAQVRQPVAPLVCGRFAPDVCRLLDRAATGTRPGPRGLERLRESSPVGLLERIQAPTLLVQGEQDSLFGLDQADANAEAIAATGTEVAVRWIDGGHDGGGTALGTADLATQATAWFDEHLRDGPPAPDDFEIVLPAPLLGDRGPTRLATATYGAEEVSLPLSGEAQTVLSPAGGQPAALTGLPGAGALLGQAVSASGAAFSLAVLPGQSATFRSEPVEQRTVVAGAPRVRLQVTSSTREATLFVSGWVVTAGGVATLPRQLVSPVRLDDLTPGEAVDVEVTLPWSAYRLQPGERVRVVASSTDAAFAAPQEQRIYQVALGAPRLLLPTVDAVGVERDALAPWPLVLLTVAVLGAAALLAGLARWRHRPAGRARTKGLDGVPLVVEGLVKEYSDGFRAVDDVSWRAEKGQVVGLLGPNGAGKTTTMRMLVGLIHADAGVVHVLGEQVRPGSPVLGRVGALIEGPGFLPHLSGRDNLDAWWAATGRPPEEAHLEEALVVADLGVAIDRPVRSYSQGMRQRLGIAQAMLGLPEVLLLDEPTNGLDPPQIRNLRGVLGDYAAAGRTVVISSHLLAEVEQTCSHVVVMHRGRVVLSGSVPALLSESASTLVGVQGDPARAAEVLRAVPGVGTVHVEPDHLRVEGEPDRPALVQALVRAGFGVTALDGRRRLEEVFMGLVGDDSAAQRGPAAVTR